MNGRSQPLFSYCLCVGGREFFIQVSQDGTIHWDDYQERRRAKGGPPHPTPGVMQDEFTVSLLLELSLMEEIRRATSLFDSAQWTVAHEQQLDKVLLPLFWNQVNARLPRPVPGPEGESEQR